MNVDSPYYHKLSREMYYLILNEYEGNTPDGAEVIQQLQQGKYPSLDWMTECDRLDPSIFPGQKEWPPLSDKRGHIPPAALGKEKPNDKQQEEAIASLVNQVKEASKTLQIVAEAHVQRMGGVQFIREHYKVSLGGLDCASC